MRNVLFVYIGLSVFMFLLAFPLLKGKIKMNRWYGCRFPKSFTSEENWYKINKYGAKKIIESSLLLILVGIIYFFIPSNLISESIEAWLFLGPIIFFVVVPAILTFIYSLRC